MLILDTITDIGFLKVFLLLKYAMYILFICTPLILMFFCFKDIADIVFNPSNANKSIKSIANRFIAALVVFLIPTIINYAFSLIEDFDDSKLIYYYNNATNEKIKSLEKKHEKELTAETAENAAEAKEAMLEKMEKEAKEAEEIKKQQEANALKNSTSQNSSSSNGNTSSNGSSSGNSSSSSGSSSGGTANYPQTNNNLTITEYNGEIKKNCGKAAQVQTLSLNGTILGQDAKITMKKGETIRVKVKVTSMCGTVQLLTRTTADGQKGWRDYFTGYSDPFVNRHDPSTFKKTDTFDWVITANKVTKGYVILSQTTFHKTAKFSEIKSMIRLNVRVIE